HHRLVPGGVLRRRSHCGRGGIVAGSVLCVGTGGLLGVGARALLWVAAGGLLWGATRDLLWVAAGGLLLVRTRGLLWVGARAAEAGPAQTRVDDRGHQGLIVALAQDGGFLALLGCGERVVGSVGKITATEVAVQRILGHAFRDH